MSRFLKTSVSEIACLVGSSCNHEEYLLKVVFICKNNKLTSYSVYLQCIDSKMKQRLCKCYSPWTKRYNSSNRQQLQQWRPRLSIKYNIAFCEWACVTPLSQPVHIMASYEQPHLQYIRRQFSWSRNGKKKKVIWYNELCFLVYCVNN